MDILVKLTTAGANVGPTFDLYSNVDNYATAFVTNVSKASLLSGYYTNLAPTDTTSVRVKSMGVDCTNFVTVNITPTTTTTTTAYPVTVDFTLTLDYNLPISSPRIISNNYTGSPSGLYEYTQTWHTSAYAASNPEIYQTQDGTEKTYYHTTTTNPGFPPGTYWFGVRDANNSYNMKVKSIEVPLITLTQIRVFFNFPPVTTLCTNPSASFDSSFWFTTSTIQAGTKVFYYNDLSYPLPLGTAMMQWYSGGSPPNPIYVVIDNAGTLAAYTC